MDLETAFIGLICVLVCAIPFVITSRNRKKREKQLVQSFRELALNANCEVSQYEIGNSYIIGIDEVKNFLFFQFKDQSKTKQEVIDLSTIASCFVDRKNLRSQLVERLDLRLVPKNRSQPVISLTFYSDDLSFQISNELHSIEKWKNLINKVNSTKDAA